MPNEYGQILLQQIEQRRQQKLRQRAEERGLPLPSQYGQTELAANDTLNSSAGGRPPAATADRLSGYSGPTSGVKLDSAVRSVVSEAHIPEVI